MSLALLLTIAAAAALGEAKKLLGIQWLNPDAWYRR
jgi:hypothetical protein